MQTIKCPEIEDTAKITVQSFIDYVAFVRELRFNQRRYFKFRKPETLETCKRMEAELDALNEKLLNPTPTLF